MPIAKITSQGLAAIALSVVLLWTCLLGERILVERASAERVLVMRELERMRRAQFPFHRRSEPVSTPVPHARPARITAG